MKPGPPMYENGEGKPNCPLTMVIRSVGRGRGPGLAVVAGGDMVDGAQPAATSCPQGVFEEAAAIQPGEDHPIHGIGEDFSHRVVRVYRFHLRPAQRGSVSPPDEWWHPSQP